MSNRWMGGALALGIAGGAMLATGCGGERQQEPVPAEVAASTELASLSIEGMT